MHHPGAWSSITGRGAGLVWFWSCLGEIHTRSRGNVPWGAESSWSMSDTVGAEGLKPIRAGIWRALLCLALAALSAEPHVVGAQPMQLRPLGHTEGSRKTLLGCSRVDITFFLVQNETVEWERLPVVSCWLLHPSRNLGCRKPMMLLCCGCSQPAASGMLRQGTIRGPALAVASSQQSMEAAVQPL